MFATRGGRAIPKNPLSINKKLSLLKKHNGITSSNSNVSGAGGSISGDEGIGGGNNTVPVNYQSSRNNQNHNSPAPMSRIGLGVGYAGS